jgi:hypothetical protein
VSELCHFLPKRQDAYGPPRSQTPLGVGNIVYWFFVLRTFPYLAPIFDILCLVVSYTVVDPLWIGDNPSMFSWGSSIPMAKLAPVTLAIFVVPCLVVSYTVVDRHWIGHNSSMSSWGSSCPMAKLSTSKSAPSIVNLFSWRQTWNTDCLYMPGMA